MRAGTPISLLLTAVLALGSGQLDAQTRQIQPGGLYPANTALASPLTGITFTLPDGFRAEWDPQMGGLVAVSNAGAFGGVWGWSEGTVEEVAAEVGARLEAQGILLEQRGEAELTDVRLRGVFDAVSGGIGGVMHALIQVGPEGGVVAVAALAEPVAEAAARAFVEGIDTSLQWSAPGAAAWRQEVAGAVLTWGGGGSDISTGATTATGASSSSATLAFCGMTEYRYQESSESYVSIPGASASSSSSDEHVGSWWLVADLAGSPTLFLEATDGRAFQWTVEEAADGFLIDGYLYRVTGQC